MVPSEHVMIRNFRVLYSVQDVRMIKKRKTYVLLTLFLGLVIYLIGRWIMGEDVPSSEGRQITRQKLNSMDLNKHLQRPSNAFNKLTPRVSSEKCRFEPLDPFRPDIVEFVVKKTPTLRCDHEFLPDITFLEDNILRVDPKRLSFRTERAADFSHCRYRSIFSAPKNDSRIVFSKWSEPFSTSMRLGEGTEFIQVECFGEPTEKVVISKTYYTLIPKRRHLDKLYDVRLKKRRVEFHPKETLNIIMVGLDGLSRHHFMRTMPKTFKYIIEALGSFDFTMHGQHGNSTVTNFLPLLTGNLESEVNQWWNISLPGDAFGFMFHDFEKAGFRTMYSEDHPSRGLYGKGRYLVKPITTYRTRPLHIAMFNDDGFVNRNHSCLGARSITALQLDYLLRFVKTFKAKPHFAFSFSDAITHDHPESTGLLDKPMVEFFNTLAMRGHLDNSLLVFFSDHGIRWGNPRLSPSGRIERRNPFLFLRFPPWFLQTYPEIAKNLEANTQVLTSPLDMYQMLSDLLYFKSDTPYPLFRTSKGISLFEKIPQRTCREAYIPEFDCLCEQWDEIPVDSSSELAIELANVLLHEVRSRTHKTKCEEYILSEITSVKMLKGYKGNFEGEQKGVLGLVHYLVRLVALPGPAIFEGIVHYDPELSKQHSVYHIVERLNLYNTGTICLPDEDMNTCYCKEQVN